MKEAGAEVRELRVTGGGAKSDILNQIKADITGREVLVPAHKEAELLGLAIIGACALGRFGSFAEAAGALVRIENRFKPDQQKAPLYEELFRVYRESYSFL